MSVDTKSVGQTGDHERAIYTDFADVEYWTSWTLRTTSEQDGPVQVLNAPAIPQPGTTFVEINGRDPNAFLVQRIAQRGPNVWNHWSIRCRYKTSPLLDPVQLALTSEPVKTAVTQDVRGNALQNSATDPFDPPFEVDNVRLVLTAMHNVPTIQPETVAMYLQDGGAVNSDQFWGFEPGLVKTAKYRARAFPKAFPNYWQEVWEFWIDANGWTLAPEDRGFRQLSPDGTRLLDILDPNSNAPVGKPALLNGQGRALAAEAAAVFLDFNVYNTLPFQALGLGI